MMAMGTVFVCLLTTISAAVTVSSCSQSSLKNILLVPPSDFVIVSTCSGTVVLDSTLNVKDGITFNATGRLTLVAAGNFPIFNVQGRAHIQGMTLTHKNGSSVDGGCISTATGANLTLVGVSFVNCRATGLGGGLHLNEGASAELSNVEFSDCTASQGGAIAMTTSSVLTCSTCDFINNTATGEGGGAVFLDEASAEFSKSWFISNEASNDTSVGGAVYSRDSSFSCQTCHFVTNSAFGSGGAFYGVGASLNASFPGSISFVDTSFLNNSGVGMGGALYTCLNPQEQLLIQNGAVCDNQLMNPGGTWVGTAVHTDCGGYAGADSVSFAGNLPEGNQFVATSLVELQFFQFCEVGTEVARDVCDIQHNVTREEANPPPPRIVSASVSHSVAAALLLLPLVF